MSSTTGHCLCRAITYAFEGNPKETDYCHCESCRRATSAPVSAWVIVPRNAFRFTMGAPRYFKSSPDVRRGFCPTCGSPLTYEADGLPDEVHLHTMTLSDPSQAAPIKHVFVAEQVPWFAIADELPRFVNADAAGEQPVRSGPRAKA